MTAHAELNASLPRLCVIEGTHCHGEESETQSETSCDPVTIPPYRTRPMAPLSWPSASRTALSNKFSEAQLQWGTRAIQIVLPSAALYSLTCSNRWCVFNLQAVCWSEKVLSPL